MWIVKFRSDEPENAAHLPTFDNGVEALPSLMVYVPAKCRLYGYFGKDCRFSLYIRLRPLGLLLLNLRAVILIVFWGKFSRIFTIEGSKFGFVYDNSGQCR